ncbi:MAG TPA: TrkA family potassium uptake protein [Capillibacterium sp.]
MKKQIVVIGLGRFGFSVASCLAELGQDVLAIDEDEAQVKKAAAVVTHAIQADATEIETLRSLGVQNFDVGIVAIGANVQANIMAALLLKELGLPYVVAKAVNELQAKVLAKIGVDRVVFPEREMGRRVAHNLLSPDLMDYMELAKDYRLEELTAPASFHGKTLRELNLRSRWGITVLLLKRAGEGGMLVSPDGDTQIFPGDTMVVFGKEEDLKRWKRI